MSGLLTRPETLRDRIATVIQAQRNTAATSDDIAGEVLDVVSEEIEGALGTTDSES